MGTNIYEIPSKNPDISYFVGTTPQTRKLIFDSHIKGVTFQQAFSLGLKSLINCFDNYPSGHYSNHNLQDVIYILRGGLNFDLHMHLGNTDNYPEVSFCSSQRFIENEKIFNGEASYNKWSIQNNSTLVIGDISATGTTLLFIIDRAIEQYKKEKKVFKNLIIVTIGTSLLIPNTQALLKKLKLSFGSDFKQITVLFLEGIFHLNQTNISYNQLNLLHTDFFVKDNIRAYEFEKEKLENPLSYFERCVIYDGGSRAFEPRLYHKNLRKYWINLYEISNHIDLKSYLKDRTDLIIDSKRNSWDYKKHIAGINDNKQQLFDQKRKELIDKIQVIGLKSICEEKLEILT